MNEGQVSSEIEELENLESMAGMGRINQYQKKRLNFLKQRFNMNMLGFEWPLWDSAQIATANTNELQLFQQPIGQSSKTLLDTNMQAAGLITTGDFYDVAAICFGLKDSAATPIPAAELREIIHTGVCELYISDRIAFQSLLVDLPTGGGPFMVNSGGGAAVGMEMASNGLPTHQAIHWFRKKIRIPRNTHFVAKLKWPTAPTPTTAINAVLRFEGMLWRRRV